MGAGKVVKGGIELVETFLKELNKPAKAAVKVTVAAPQDEALRLAQQRAALPPAQGGLGLPANNTPMQRAKAMGGKEAVHFSRHGGDYKTLDSGKFAIAPFDAVGTHVGTPNAAAERFENTVGYKINNPNYAFDELKGASYPVVILDKKPLTNQNSKPWAEEELNNFLREIGGHNLSESSDLQKDYRDMNAALRQKLFEQEGYTSIPYFNDVEGRGDVSYIVSPDNIRSRFAAFDPWRKDAATAAAFGVAAPDLLAKEQEKAMGGEVHMGRGGAMPKKTTVMEDIQSLGDPAMALADMLAGKLRGTTAAATGFYGDMEDLVRKYGKGLPANVIRALLPTREGKETLLPTVEEMNAMLPPVVPKGAARSTQMAQTYNDLGMANPLAPTAIGAVKPIAKVVGPIVKAGALDLARSEPARRTVNRVAEASGTNPMFAIPPEENYRGSHTAPNAKDYGAYLHDLTAIMPKNVYTTQGKNLYGIGDPVIDREWWMTAMKAKGNPEAEVTVYRAVPKGVNEINSGDWVTTSKKYAENHGASALNDEYEILAKKVKAKNLSTAGDPQEYGYHLIDDMAAGGEVHMADGGSADFFIDPSAYAQAKSKEMYPKKKSEWTEQDAARHMLAAGMMAQKFGPTAAKMAGLAHEHFNAPIKTLGYALGIGKMPADYEQDLHNNALGIALAKRAANQEELERLIREATGKSSKTQIADTPWIGEPKNAARLSDY